MGIRSVLVVILAIICGLAAAVGMNQLRRPVSVETGPVVVAATNIARGSMLNSKVVEIREWPKDLVPSGALVRVDEVDGRSSAIPFLAGEPILDGKLAPMGGGRGLAALIPKGLRACTIQASRAASSVAGFILPGNKVDVLMTLRGNPQDSSGGGSTLTLLQSVEILAVDQQLDAPADNKTNLKELSSVTILVTPRQATLLDLGQNLGQLTLALRNPEDCEEEHSQPTSLADIGLGTAKHAVEPKQAQGSSSDASIADGRVTEIVTLRGIQRGRILVTRPGSARLAYHASGVTTTRRFRVQ